MLELQAPLSEGDVITQAIEERWRKLENTDIDDDKDVMYYRAHITIKDMYALKINERIQKFMQGQMAQREKEISELSQMQIFGKTSNQEEVTKIFDGLMEEYKYEVVPEPLLFGRYDHRKIGNIIYSLKDQSSFWSSESPESLKKKEEGLALLSERVEEHLDHWISHLDKLEPELDHLKSKIDDEVKKINCLTDHFAFVNMKQRDYLNLSNTILTQQQLLSKVIKDLQLKFTQFQQVNNPELQFNVSLFI